MDFRSEMQSDEDDDEPVIFRRRKLCRNVGSSSAQQVSTLSQPQEMIRIHSSMDFEPEIQSDEDDDEPVIFRRTRHVGSSSAQQKVGTLSQEMRNSNELQTLKAEIEKLKLEIKEMEVVIDQLKKKLCDKEEALEHIDGLANTLIVKERHQKDELQQLRELLIPIIRERQDVGSAVGVKIMGGLNPKQFSEALKNILKPSSSDEVSYRSDLLCSFWVEMIKDLNWHPFKVTLVDGKHQELIDREDTLLAGLEKQCGEKVYNEVVNALVELNEYNPSGRYPVEELWNYKERRRATLFEAVSSIVGHL